MEKILEAARQKSDAADIMMVSVEETPVEFEANRLKNIQNKQTGSMALRIIRDGRLGYASTTDMDAGTKLVDMALETAEFGMNADFTMPEQAEYPVVEVDDPAVGEVSMETMVHLGESMISAVKTHTPDIVCEAGVSKSVISVRILNTSGIDVSWRRTVFGMGVGGTLINGTDMLFVGESRNSCHPLTDSSEITEVVIEQLELARRQASVCSGQMPVIFTPNGVASALLSPLMAAFNGKTVLEGASPVGDKLGKTVFDRRFFLNDDPTLPFCPNSRCCDDEGVPSRCTTLISQGTVEGFLYDLQTAGRAGTASTGSGSRGRGGLVSPSPSAFTVAGGEISYKKIIEGISDGLLVEQLMGAEQGNVLGGDFSGNVLLGYKIESGEIVGRVKDVMVSGNIYHALKDIAALSSETKWVGGILRTPWICCDNLSVAGR